VQFPQLLWRHTHIVRSHAGRAQQHLLPMRENNHDFRLRQSCDKQMCCSYDEQEIWDRGKRAEAAMSVVEPDRSVRPAQCWLPLHAVQSCVVPPSPLRNAGQSAGSDVPAHARFAGACAPGQDQRLLPLGKTANTNKRDGPLR